MAIAAGSLEIEVTVAVNQLTDDVIFETSVGALSASIARLSTKSDGTIVDHFGTLVSSYAPSTPLRFRSDLDMATMRWACTVDDELDAFADDPVVSGLPFINSGIPHIGTPGLAPFDDFSACTGSRVLAYDDVSIVNFPPISSTASSPAIPRHGRERCRRRGCSLRSG